MHHRKGDSPKLTPNVESTAIEMSPSLKKVEEPGIQDLVVTVSPPPPPPPHGSIAPPPYKKMGGKGNANAKMAEAKSKDAHKQRRKTKRKMGREKMKSQVEVEEDDEPLLLNKQSLSECDEDGGIVILSPERSHDQSRMGRVQGTGDVEGGREFAPAPSREHLLHSDIIGDGGRAADTLQTSQLEAEQPWVSH